MPGKLADFYLCFQTCRGNQTTLFSVFVLLLTAFFAIFLLVLGHRLCRRNFISGLSHQDKRRYRVISKVMNFQACLCRRREIYQRVRLEMQPTQFPFLRRWSYLLVLHYHILEKSELKVEHLKESILSSKQTENSMYFYILKLAAKKIFSLSKFCIYKFFLHAEKRSVKFTGSSVLIWTT